MVRREMGRREEKKWARAYLDDMKTKFEREISIDFVQKFIGYEHV